MTIWPPNESTLCSQDSEDDTEIRVFKIGTRESFGMSLTQEFIMQKERFAVA